MHVFLILVIEVIQTYKRSFEDPLRELNSSQTTPKSQVMQTIYDYWTMTETESSDEDVEGWNQGGMLGSQHRHRMQFRFRGLAFCRARAQTRLDLGNSYSERHLLRRSNSSVIRMTANESMGTSSPFNSSRHCVIPEWIGVDCIASHPMRHAWIQRRQYPAH
jgi:hypothetical protein